MSLVSILLLISLLSCYDSMSITCLRPTCLTLTTMTWLLNIWYSILTCFLQLCFLVFFWCVCVCVCVYEIVLIFYQYHVIACLYWSFAGAMISFSSKVIRRLPVPDDWALVKWCHLLSSVPIPIPAVTCRTSWVQPKVTGVLREKKETDPWRTIPFWVGSPLPHKPRPSSYVTWVLAHFWIH